MARLRPRASAKVTSVLLSFFLHWGDALIHPNLSAASRSSSNASRKLLLLPNANFPRHRRGRSSTPSLSSSWSSSSSRISRLDDVIVSAAERMRKPPPSTRMSISSGNLSISVHAFGGEAFTIKASHVEPGSGIRRTWTATRSEKEFFTIGATLMGQLGGATLQRRVPSPPPRGSSPEVYQIYLRRLIDLPDAFNLPALYEFLDAPPELVQEPVLFGEVVDEDFWSDSAQPFRSANPNDPRGRPSSSSPYSNSPAGDRGHGNKSGATVAGAVLGGLVAGPIGAAVGAFAVRAASGREDGVGSVAKGAGAVADAAMEKAQALEREFELSRKAKTAAEKAKRAVQKVEADYGVRQRAGDAARKTVRAARQTSRDLRVSERAKGAARATEQAAKRAAEVARRADEEHRLRERAGNAFRSVRSLVKRSVGNVEERRKRGGRSSSDRSSGGSGDNASGDAMSDN